MHTDMYTYIFTDRAAALGSQMVKKGLVQK